MALTEFVSRSLINAINAEHGLKPLSADPVQSLADHAATFSPEFASPLDVGKECMNSVASNELI